MRISDWSSDVCSSDLIVRACAVARPEGDANARADRQLVAVDLVSIRKPVDQPFAKLDHRLVVVRLAHDDGQFVAAKTADAVRSEEHTSELQSLMRISYAAFCTKTPNVPPNSWTKWKQHTSHRRADKC